MSNFIKVQNRLVNLDLVHDIFYKEVAANSGNKAYHRIVFCFGADEDLEFHLPLENINELQDLLEAIMRQNNRR